MNIKFKKLDPDAIIPKYETCKSIGLNLYALKETTIIGGCCSVIVQTGISAQTMNEIHLRIDILPALAVTEHLSIITGAIIEDELCAIMYMTKPNRSYTLNKGERFAIIIPEIIIQHEIIEVDKFDDEVEEEPPQFLLRPINISD